MKKSIHTPVAPLLDSLDAARFLNLKTPATLANWRTRGQGPAYIKVGGSIRYRMEDLERWLSQQRVEIK